MSHWTLTHYRKIRKNRYFRSFTTLFAISLASLLQTYCLQVFIQPAQLMSSGFLGLSILINRIAQTYGINLSISFLILLLNFPVALACYRGISPRFTFYSVLQVIMGSFLMRILDFQPIFDDLVLNIVFGGVLNGIYISIALRGNASTGGMDFVALYFSNKSGRTIWQQVFLFNTSMLMIFGYLFGWELAGYSIIFQYISTKVISTFHKRYQRVTLQITTKEADKVMAAYLANIRHGISCVEAVGGFSHEKMYLLHTVISSYELIDAIAVLQEADPRIIINQIPSENFYGNYYREPE